MSPAAYTPGTLVILVSSVLIVGPLGDSVKAQPGMCLAMDDAILKEVAMKIALTCLSSPSANTTEFIPSDASLTLAIWRSSMAIFFFAKVFFVASSD